MHFPTLLAPAPTDAPLYTGQQPVSAVDAVPAPWALTGEGWVVFFRLSAADAARPGILRPELRGTWQGGIGAVSFMRYRSSGVGPYDELLFIPGRVEIGGQTAFSISQIYVTSEASVVNGRANWGIPKDYAPMQIERRDTGEDVLRAGPEDAPFATLIARPGGPRLPLDSSRFPLSIAQLWDDQTFRISLTVKARVSWLDVVHWRADGIRFPSLVGHRPLAAVKLDDFDITFPVASIEPA
ncbi:MAG: acetoacetate decarboxylase family protein [Anaerolineae bacterium]